MPNEQTDVSRRIARARELLISNNPWFASMLRKLAVDTAAIDNLQDAVANVAASTDFHDWNIAADHTINLMLLDLGFALPAGSLVDEKYRGMTTEEIRAQLSRANSIAARPGQVVKLTKRRNECR